MIQFFQNCWQWIVENKEGIYGFFTSANFLAFITTLTALIKCIKSTNKNTISNNQLKESVEATSFVKEGVQLLTGNSQMSNKKLEEVADVQIKMKQQLDDFVQNTNSKINAMLEVQTIVYSTIKDDTIRNSVNTILVDAKHCEAEAKAKLQQELEELKSKLVEATSKITTEITETVDNVENVMHVGTNISEEPNVRRY